MGEVVRGPQEAGWRQEDELAGGGGGRPLGLAVEGALEDLLDPPDVVELEEERSATGGIEPLTAVLVGQAQELLTLAKLRPGEVAGQERLHEATDVRALALRLTE